MIKKLLLSISLVFWSLIQVQAQTPLSLNGRLKLVGKQLSNQCGSPVQLKGISTHAVQAHKNCLTAAAVQSIAKDWGSDALRLAVYTKDVGQSKGYINGNKTEWNDWIDQMVTLAKTNGMYVIIDWHILDDGNPNTYVAEAKTFFTTMSAKYKNETHVLYEICNEPNSGTDWNSIKTYADQIIPLIRANDKEAMILVGTPEWSSKPRDVLANPLSTANAYNVMYTFHFYSGSHYDYGYLRDALGKVPVFVTEWGTSSATGDGGYDPNGADNWIKVMDGDNSGGVKVSSCNWAFVDKGEVSSLLTSGSCDLGNWTNKTTSGNYVYNYVHKADNFVACNAAADDDGDGVSNGSDACASTPKGTFVDSRGCPALQGDADFDGVIDAADICPSTPAGSVVNRYGCPLSDPFLSNVCIGFNNKQGYARTDFSEDSLVNLDYWNRPNVKNSVYSASTINKELVIKCTGADPKYATMGFSFGQDKDGNLIPLDLRGNAKLKMKVNFQKSNTVSYTPTTVLMSIELEDVKGKSVNAITNVNTRKSYPVEASSTTWTNVEFDFINASFESYNGRECLAAGFTDTTKKPCYIKNFDLSKVNKVKMVVNPSAGESWSRPAFTGTWKIDDFSIGYDAATVQNCTTIRDDDGDGVKEELDTCRGTTPGAVVNNRGCANSQLDDDKDKVLNANDLCPNTPAGVKVNTKGCSDSQADDDNDGVTNNLDQCPNTPSGTKVNSVGCVITAVNDELMGQLMVYPNPAVSVINIEQTKMNFNTAEILDMSGSSIQKFTLTDAKESLSISKLNKGVYCVKLSGNDKVETLKIVVE